MKLARYEAATEPLRRWLLERQDDTMVTSSLARKEVVRAVWASGHEALSAARRLLGKTFEIDLDRALLDDAAMLHAGTPLRSLDAIHLASARLLGTGLRAVVTYDMPMQEAAHALGMPTAAPA